MAEGVTTSFSDMGAAGREEYQGRQCSLQHWLLALHSPGEQRAHLSPAGWLP